MGDYATSCFDSVAIVESLECLVGIPGSVFASESLVGCHAGSVGVFHGGCVDSVGVAFRDCVAYASRPGFVGVLGRSFDSLSVDERGVDSVGVADDFVDSLGAPGDRFAGAGKVVLGNFRA